MAPSKRIVQFAVTFVVAVSAQSVVHGGDLLGASIVNLGVGSPPQRLTLRGAGASLPLLPGWPAEAYRHLHAPVAS